MFDKMKCVFCEDTVSKKDYQRHLELSHTYHYKDLLRLLENGKKFDASINIFDVVELLDRENIEISYKCKEDNLKYSINSKYKPNNFDMETTTLWDFPQRGSWATHNGKYRGNWSPYIPRNIILRYSQQDDVVLDQFLGSGTTLIETKLLKRKGIGIDINQNALNIAEKNTQFNVNQEYHPEMYLGDARNLDRIASSSIDLICTHPPYSNIIKYSEGVLGDLSHYHIEDFLFEMQQVAKESFRVLKDKKYCAILIGDMRKNKKMIPLGFRTMQVFLDAGFELKETIIKGQHNCRTTGFWYEKSIKYNFLLIAHEYLFVFTK